MTPESPRAGAYDFVRSPTSSKRDATKQAAIQHAANGPAEARSAAQAQRLARLEGNAPRGAGGIKVSDGLISGGDSGRSTAGTYALDICANGVATTITIRLA